MALELALGDESIAEPLRQAFAGRGIELSEDELCERVRTSFLFVAPLLHRLGRAKLHPPGGDGIGRRRLDTHFYGLEKLGSSIEIDRSYLFKSPKGSPGTTSTVRFRLTFNFSFLNCS